MAVNAIGVSAALEERHLGSAVVDRVRGMPVVTDHRRRGRRPVLSSEEHEPDAEDDNETDDQGEAELARLGRATRRGRGLGRPLDLLGRTCFTHGTQR